MKFTLEIDTNDQESMVNALKVIHVIKRLHTPKKKKQSESVSEPMPNVDNPAPLEPSNVDPNVTY